MLTNYSVERDKILVIGANGQLGSVLSVALQKSFGEENVILSDIKPNPFFESHFKQIDAMDFNQIEDVVKKYSITQIYHLAAILSAAGETYPLRTWELSVPNPPTLGHFLIKPFTLGNCLAHACTRLEIALPKPVRVWKLHVQALERWEIALPKP